MTTDAAVVRPDGKITLPLLNDVDAAGPEARAVARSADGAVEKAGSWKTRGSPSASARSTAARCYIVGGVNKPGAYDLLVPDDVLQLISIAGGLREFVSGKKIMILREEGGKTERAIKFNLQGSSGGKEPGAEHPTQARRHGDGAGIGLDCAQFFSYRSFGSRAGRGPDRVCAQRLRRSVRPARIPACLVPRATADASHTLDLRGSLFGAWDDTLTSGDTSAVDPRFLRSGTAGGASGSLAHARRSSRFEWQSGVASSLRMSGSRERRHGGDVRGQTAINTTISRRVSLSGSGGFAYSPYYDFSPGLDGRLSNVGAFGGGFGVATAAQRNTTASAGSGVNIRLSRRDTLDVYGQRSVDMSFSIRTTALDR